MLRNTFCRIRFWACCALALAPLLSQARVELQWSDSFSLPETAPGQANPGVARPYCGEHQEIGRASCRERV